MTYQIVLPSSISDSSCSQMFGIIHQCFPTYSFNNSKSYDEIILHKILHKNGFTIFGKSYKSTTRVVIYNKNEPHKTILKVKSSIDEDNPKDDKESFVTISICSVNETYLLYLVAEIEKAIIEQKAEQHIYLLRTGAMDGCWLSKELISNEIDLNLPINYGEEFMNVHENIINKLNEKSRSGLYLFHGPPGTGKSSYIKYLTGKINKKFIYMPSGQIHLLSDPSLISILIENKDSILILEDAEKAIISRDLNTGNESLTASILNFSDGLLGSLLSINIILTFNTSKEEIDEALMRKGRLKIEHCFNKLSITDAQKLVDHLKLDYTVTEPKSLAEIYYLNDENYKKEKDDKKGFIGFQKI